MDYTKTNIVIKEFEKALISKSKKGLLSHSNSGKLERSINVSHTQDKGNYALSVHWEDYGEFVDDGRKPGKGIPVSKLKQWIVSKKMTVRDANGKSVSMTDSKLDGLAYVINRKIKNEGIKPTYFLTKPLEEMINKFANDVAYAIGEDILADIMKDSFE